MKRARPAATAFVLIAVLAGTAAGDDPEIVVTARGYPSPARDVGTALTSIDVEELDRSAIDELVEALRSAPGVATVRGGGVGAASSLFLRGAASNQTKVLLDGFALNDPTIGGQFNPYDTTLAGLGRIEVLRGSHSTLYGSEAIGGVVQMVSRDYRGPTFVSFRASGGSFATYGGRLEVGGGDDRFAGGLFASGFRTDNDVEPQDFRSLTLGGRIDWSPGRDVDVGVTLRYVASEAQDPYDFGNPLPRDDHVRRERDTTLVGASFTWRAGPAVTFRSRASWTRIDSDFTNGGDAPGDPDELASTAEARVVGGRSSLTVDLVEAFGGATTEGLGAALTAGVEVETARSFNEVASPFGTTTVRDETRERAAFGQLDLTLVDALHLSGGVRFTDHDFAGTKTTWTASALVRLEATGTDLSANASTGFRAPTPVEFADPFVGNADLTSESSRSFDIGVRQRLLDDALVAELTGFQLEVDDLIAYDPGSFVLQNFARTRTRGVEAGLRWEIDRTWACGASFTWQDPRDLEAGAGEEDRLPNRPKRFGTCWASYRVGDWSFLASFTHSGDAPSIGIAGPNRAARRHPGARNLLDVAASWQVHDALRLFARVENALDDVYVENERGARGNGVGFRIGFELTLK